MGVDVSTSKCSLQKAVGNCWQHHHWSLGDKQWYVKPAEPNDRIVTVHWVPPEMDDKIIISYLCKFRTVDLNVTEHCVFDDKHKLAGIKTGIRRYKVKFHDTVYVHNYVIFGFDDVMFPFPGQTPECSRCGQARHYMRECRAEMCANCKGYSSHNDPHNESNCPLPCNRCGGSGHNVKHCHASATSYASAARSRPPFVTAARDDTATTGEDGATKRKFSDDSESEEPPPKCPTVEDEAPRGVIDMSTPIHDPEYPMVPVSMDSSSIPPIPDSIDSSGISQVPNTMDSSVWKSKIDNVRIVHFM